MSLPLVPTSVSFPEVPSIVHPVFETAALVLVHFFAPTTYLIDADAELFPRFVARRALNLSDVPFFRPVIWHSLFDLVALQERFPDEIVVFTITSFFKREVTVNRIVTL
jgi:hypothetical protein